MTHSFDRFTQIYDVRQNKAPVRIFKVGVDLTGPRPNLCGNIFSGSPLFLPHSIFLVLDDGSFILSPGHNTLHKISVEAGVLVSSMFLGITPTSLLLDDRDSTLLAAEARSMTITVSSHATVEKPSDQVRVDRAAQQLLAEIASLFFFVFLYVLIFFCLAQVLTPRYE